MDHALLDKKGDSHFGVLPIASYVFLSCHFYPQSGAWNVFFPRMGQGSTTS